MFEQAGAVVLAISPQDVDSHEKFAAQEGFTFPLLADIDLVAGREWGIVKGKLYRRSVFVLDGEGTVRYKNVKFLGASWKTAKDLKGILEKI